MARTSQLTVASDLGGLQGVQFGQCTRVWLADGNIVLDIFIPPTLVIDDIISGLEPVNTFS